MNTMYLTLLLMSALSMLALDIPREAALRPRGAVIDITGSEHGMESEVLATEINGTHLNNPKRRECVATADVEHGEFDYDCDKYLPTLEQCLLHVENMDYINSPDLMPIYYTGWPEDVDKEDLMLWMLAYMKAYIAWPEAPSKVTSCYWYWNVIDQEWFVEKFLIWTRLTPGRYDEQEEYLEQHAEEIQNLSPTVVPGDSLDDTLAEVLLICMIEAYARACIHDTGECLSTPSFTTIINTDIV